MTDQAENGNGHKSEEDVPSQEDKNQHLTKEEQDIIKQVEYYFGESNMRRDKFLIQKIDENEGKWVPISVLLTFNRLKALSEDPKAIAEAMLKSSNGLVEVSEDKEKVRRHPDNPLPEFNENRRKELSQRTAYAKGFPLDSTTATILEYFKDFENIENVILRKYFSAEKEYKFKGSVFILFSTKEAAEEFVKREELKCGEKVLLRYMQEEYIKKKRQEEKEKRERRKQKDQKKEAQAMKVELPRKAILHFVTEATPTVRREEIKKKILEIEPSLTISFIHYDMGDKAGDIRFSKENDGVKFLEKLGEDAKLTVGGTDFTVTLLEGEAEEKFLEKAVEDMQKSRAKQAKGGRHQKGGHHNNRKRKNDDADKSSESKAKQVKENENVAVVAAAE